LTAALVVAALALGGWIGAGELRGQASWLDRLEYLSLDGRFLTAGARPPPSGVVIAAIDDRTLSEDKSHSLSRALVARIVRGLAELHPRAVVVDVAFPDPKPEDAELAEALRMTTNVIAAVGLFGDEAEAKGPSTPADLELTPRPSRVLWPTDVLRDAATEIGLANVSTDVNGVPRFIPMIFQVDDGVLPSLALAAAAAAVPTDPVLGDRAIELAGRRTETDLGYHMALRFYGPAQNFHHFSAAALLGGELDPASVGGKIVLVGVTATGLADMFSTPFDRLAPGVTIFATAIGNLTEGGALIRTPTTRAIDAATTPLLPVALIGVMALRRVGLGLAIAVFVLALWIVLVFVAFLQGYWLEMAAPLAVGVLSATAYAAGRLILERATGAKLVAQRTALAKFQSPLLLDRILRQPDFLEKPVTQDAGVLFLDLSGSTGVSEALGPERSRDMLHAMQTLVEREAAAGKGVVITYMGDGVLAAFGLPAPQPDDAARTLATVERLYDAMTEWIAGLPPEATGRLDFRIGAHFGSVVISRLGSPSHQQITLAGDTVNVASRLLEVAKQQNCRVVVSADLFAIAAGGLSAHAEAYVALTVPIRGRAGALAIRARGYRTD